MKKIIFIILSILASSFVSAEYLGNKPSVDFTFSPEFFLADEIKISNVDSESHFGVGVNGNLLINLKLANFIYGYGSNIEKDNVFGFYLKNSYSGTALTSRQYFDMNFGGGIHGAFPMIPIGMEIGVLYSPIYNNLSLEDFVGYIGDKITAGIRTNVGLNYDRINLELLFAWNFRFDIRNKTYKRIFEEKAEQNQKDWIKTHSFEKEARVSDFDFLTDFIKNGNLNIYNEICDFHLTARYYKDRKGSDILQEIILTYHTLGNGKPGTEEYIIFTTKKIPLSFRTDEEKENSLNLILAEYNTRKEQKARIAENRRLNPDNYDYQNLPVLSMATMGVKYAPNPVLIPGKVYIADQLRLFYIINSMDNGDYNIGQEESVYGMYQFILKNSSGEAMGGIGGHMFADTAYLRYLGTTKVIMSNGYERWLPYFEMIKKNPHISNVAKIVRECEEW